MSDGSARSPATGKVIPYLLYENAPAAIEFLSRAFGFREIERTAAPDGTVMNCELRGPEGGDLWLGQMRRQGTTMVYVYVADVDAHCERARAAEAEIVSEPQDQFFGDRRYQARDLEGHTWFFASPISDRSPFRRP